jgi:glutathione S-transferase
MSDLTLLGFPRSTFVQIVGLVLTHKDAPYTFRDLEPDMGSPVHLAVNRQKLLTHLLGDFVGINCRLSR